MSLYYRVSVCPSSQHLAVELTFRPQDIIPTASTTTHPSAIELMLPCWTPGSYLIRDYARFVSAVTLTQPNPPVRLKKTRKNRWLLPPTDADTLCLHYDVYCPEKSVRTNWLTEDSGLIVGAAAFLVPLSALALPIYVALNPPTNVYAYSTLPFSTDQNAFVAPNYDALVDSAFGLSAIPPSQQLKWQNQALHAIWLGSASDTIPEPLHKLPQILTQMTHFWGNKPFDDYTVIAFANSLPGGLEHAHGAVVAFAPTGPASRSHTPKPTQLARKHDHLSLLTHEMFHAWNGKRLRPRGFGPFDYEHETYTELLYLVEGVTSYYDDLLTLRAGLVPITYYWQQLSQHIHNLRKYPTAEHQQTLHESSWDAWIKFYQPHSDSHNTTVSYYTKGALLAWWWDALMREHSDGKISLDTLFRRFYRQHHHDPLGYREEDFWQCFADECGVELAQRCSSWLDHPQPLEYETPCRVFGLKLRYYCHELPSLSQCMEATLGVVLAESANFWQITKIIRGGLAEHHQLRVHDKIWAINNMQTPACLAFFEPQHIQYLLISRHQHFQTLYWDPPLCLCHPMITEIQPDPHASDKQLLQRQRWLSGEQA